MVTVERSLVPKAYENVQQYKLLLARTEQTSQDAQTLECDIRKAQEQIKATWTDIQDVINAQRDALRTGIDCAREMQEQIKKYDLKQEGK